MSGKSCPILISCGIVQTEIEKLIEQQKLEVEPTFLDAGLHVVYKELEKELESALEKNIENADRGIVVFYGDMCHPRIKKIVDKYKNAVKVDGLNCIDCLLGGHQNLLKVDPKCSHFYLSPGWMPSNMKKSPHFMEIFNWKIDGIEEQFEHLDGLIIINSLDNIEEYNDDIEEFSQNTKLKVKKIKNVGLNGLKTVIDEAIKKIHG
ncbi:MAG: DUF1638 domain-containing protein [Candidatus Bathyarchaeota archaeon]